MPKNLYRTNPTGLKFIERSLISLRVHRDSSAKIKAFSVEKADLGELALPANAPVSIVPYSGFNEKRIDLGTAGAVQLRKNVSLEDIETSSLIFRFLVREPEGHKLLAACEGIKPTDE